MTYLEGTVKLGTVTLAGSCSGMKRAGVKLIQCTSSIVRLEMPDILNISNQNIDSVSTARQKYRGNVNFARESVGASHIATRQLFQHGSEERLNCFSSRARGPFERLEQKRNRIDCASNFAGPPSDDGKW